MDMKLIRCVLPQMDVHIPKWMGIGCILMGKVKLTDYGAASKNTAMSKEDERSARFAVRALKGDYDDGIPLLHASFKSSFTDREL